MEGELKSMTRGDTSKFPFLIMDPPAASGLPPGPGYTQTLTGATVYFAAKHDPSDAAVVFLKSSPSTGISIVAVGSPTVPGQVLVQLAAIDTSGLPNAGTALFYELVIVDAAGGHYTAAKGPLVVIPDSYTAN
jgi:hypothetical protein